MFLLADRRVEQFVDPPLEGGPAVVVSVDGTGQSLAARREVKVSLWNANPRGESVRILIVRVPVRDPLRTEYWNSGTNILLYTEIG